VIEARAGSAGDEQAVTRLRADAERELAALRGGVRLIEQTRDRSVDHIIVGTIGGHVVGFASVSFDGAVATVHELFVEVEARTVGVAHAILDEAATEARQRGCSELDSVVLPGSRESKNFFESHAMVSRLLTVSRTLDES